MVQPQVVIKEIYILQGYDVLEAFTHLLHKNETYSSAQGYSEFFFIASSFEALSWRL